MADKSSSWMGKGRRPIGWADIQPPRVGELGLFYDSTFPVDEQWQVYRSGEGRLDRFSLIGRYPTEADARMAMLLYVGEKE